MSNEENVFNNWFTNLLLYFQIMEALETDTNCRRLNLAHRLENVACTFEGEETSACWPHQSPDPLLPRKMAPWFNVPRARTRSSKYNMSIFKVSRFPCKGQVRDIRSVWVCEGALHFCDKAQDQVTVIRHVLISYSGC